MINNYYETLGLTPKANSQQIAENYRKLALRFHPKTSKQTPQVASGFFNALAEAYQVLSDPIKRAFYDKFGYQALKGGIYNEGGLTGGYHYGNNPDQIFQKFFKGGEQLNKVLDLAISQQGSLFGHAFGGLQHSAAPPNQDLVVTVTCTLDELYSGATRTAVYSRRVLNADGRTTTVQPWSRKLNVKAGYGNNTVLQFAGEGHQTVHGTASNLVLKIEEKPHPQYSRQGDNLIYTHRLDLADAINGGVIQVQTLDNRTISVAVEGIVSPRVLQEVAGEGMVGEDGKRGHLFIRFDVAFPTTLTEEVRAQLRQLLG